MSRIDSEEERLRLGQYYSGLTDEELEQLAAQAADLTLEARGSLEQERSKRGLGVGHALPSLSPDELESRPLRTIRQFRDLPEALLAKGALESAGIETFLADENMVRMDWFISNFIGGVKLKVNPEDVETALAILDQPIPDSFEVDGIGNYQQPSCPQCHSLDTTFEELNKPLAYASAYLSVPIPLHSKLWKCKVCGYEWEDAVPPQSSQEKGI